MAQPPLTFLETKWKNGYSSNQLVRAATQTNQREQIPMVDMDTFRTISPFGRRTLSLIGRYLYWNCPPLRGAIDEMARLAVSTLIAQYYGENKDYGKQVEDYLYENDRYCDVRGGPFSMAIYNQNLVRESLIDGELGTLLATDANGEAKIQTWRSHRIGSIDGINAVIADPAIPSSLQFDGYRLIDGVVVNEFGAAIGYALLSDDRTRRPMAYVPANDFILGFLPSCSDQLRGLSAIGCAAFNWMDREESQRFELVNQKLAGTFGVMVHNETGQVDRAKRLITNPATAPDSTTGNATSLPTELVTPGRIMYVKAGTGQKIDQMENNRPGPNYTAFQEEVMRGCFESMGWSFDFAHNATKIGGAPLRIVIEKVEAKLQEIRDLLVIPVRRRVDGWRVSKGTNQGRLPKDKDWYKIHYQGPAKLSADRKYDSDIDIAETAVGMMTDQKACGKRGDWWEETYDQKDIEADKKWTKAGILAKKHGIKIEQAYSSMWENNPNGITSSAAAMTAKPNSTSNPES